MGLLDDAIREHLDLKRRRGADPTELEQAEREALGPVRRDPFEQEEGEFDPSASGGFAYDQEEDVLEEEGYANGGERHVAESDWDEAFADEPVADEPQFEQPAAAAPPAESFSEPTEVVSADGFDEEEAAAYEDPAVPPPHPADHGAGAETVEYDVEQAMETESTPPIEEEHPAPRAAPPLEQEHPVPHAAEPHERDPDAPPTGSDEDVLEETPEFLQDTPDHDRLWFEQRPPRDFDFDG